jgi:hypothetical protein
MAKKPETVSVLGMLGNKPLVLTGEPRRIRGRFNLTNTGDEQVVVRGAQLRTASKTKRRGAQPALEVNYPIHPIIVRPGRSRSVSVRMSIDPYTPPGEYEAELEVGGETTPIKLHVIEKVDLSIFPDRLIIRDAPGASVSKRIIVRNNGNVPVSIGEIGAVVLEDERLECRLVRRIVAALDSENEEAELEDHLRTAIAQAQSVFQQAGALRVRNRSGTVTIEPGSTEPIDLEIQLPNSLDRRTRYTGSVALYNSDLVFVIAPILGDIPDKNNR